jgi:hypothetical protein
MLSRFRIRNVVDTAVSMSRRFKHAVPAAGEKPFDKILIANRGRVFEFRTKMHYPDLLALRRNSMSHH